MRLGILVGGFGNSTIVGTNAKPTSGSLLAPLLRLLLPFNLSRDCLAAEFSHGLRPAHGFIVRPSGNFVSALPHASSNCIWVKFVAPLRSAPLRWAPVSLAPLRLASLRLALVRLALLRLASFRLATPSRWAPLRSALPRSAPLRSALPR